MPKQLGSDWRPAVAWHDAQPIQSASSLPDFAEGTQFDPEGPGGAILVGDTVHLLGYRRWLGEELIWFVGSQQWAGARRVDGSVDNKIGDVDAFGPKLAFP